MNKFFKIVIVNFLIVSFVADAGLVRRGGRGSETSTSPNSYYLVDNSWVVTAPGGFSTLSADNYADALSASPSQSTTAGKYKLLVVPFDGCAEEYPFGTYDGTPPEFLPEWNGCDWEFYEEERLFVYGDFPLFLPGAFDYDIKFSISNDSGDTWLMDDADTYVDAAGGTGLPDGGVSTQGMVFLDAQRPADLVAGDYTISVSVEMFSGPNQTFFHYQDENSGLFIDCATIVDPDDFCFVSSGLYASDSLSFTADFSETLRILPRPAVINEPSKLILLGAGLLLLFSRRRKRE